MNDKEIIFSVQGLSRTFGNTEVLRDITLGFYYGAKIGVIGRNGTGKSTLLRIIAGEDTGFEGKLTKKKDLRIGFVPQEPQLDEDKTVRENIELGVAAIRSLLAEFEEVSIKLGEDLSDDEMQACYDRMAELQDGIDHADAWEIDRQIDQAMHALACPAGDAPVAPLSGGEKRRVALCKMLLSHPDVLLLDEPTNHLDAETVAWLEKHLADYPGTVILITHDRYFLDNVVGWMLEIDRGTGSPYEGNYSEYLVQKQRMMVQEEKIESSRQRAIKEELAWIRQSPRARQKKNKARVEAFHELQSKTYEKVNQMPALSFPQGRRLGDRVVSFDGVSKGYDGRKLIDDFSFDLPPGGIVGVVGPNGVGKTTLLRLIVGQEEPDEGTVNVASNVDLCYVDQSRQELGAKKTVYEEISGGQEVFIVGKHEIRVRAWIARFGFTGEDQEKSVGVLSGGQRNRLQMAKILVQGGNLVMLDEPTNDLDIPTLRLLEEALMEYPGCAIVVSHDRYFLDRVATHIMAFEGGGKVRLFEGGYQSYADRVAEERRERGELEKKGTHRRFK